ACPPRRSTAHLRYRAHRGWAAGAGWAAAEASCEARPCRYCQRFGAAPPSAGGWSLALRRVVGGTGRPRLARWRREQEGGMRGEAVPALISEVGSFALAVGWLAARHAYCRGAGRSPRPFENSKTRLDQASSARIISPCTSVKRISRPPKR